MDPEFECRGFPDREEESFTEDRKENEGQRGGENGHEKREKAQNPEGSFTEGRPPSSVS